MGNTSCLQRVTNLRNKMEKAGFDTLIIASDENRRYLTGYTGEDGGYDETAGVMVLTQNHQILACDPRYDTQAEKEAMHCSVIRYDKDLAEKLPEILDFVGANKIGVESARVTLKHFQKWNKAILKNFNHISISPANTLFDTLRIKKDEHEIVTIRKALKIAETSFLKFKDQLCEQMSEKEAAWLLEKIMRENGADALAFPVIAASGENSALPHAIPTDRKIKSGEPVIFDFGAKYNGYCSDTTRSLILKQSNPAFEEIFTILRKAQETAVSMIKPGVKTKDIDHAARSCIDRSPYKGKFSHSLGHGVGMAVHEAPRLSRLDTSSLQENMIVTVEPGIYMPGWGGLRLENMVRVTNSGAEILNETPLEDCIV